MTCGCNKSIRQGRAYCQECMPDELHWLVPVSKEPDPFLMDRNHAYILPNNTIYVLSHDRTQAIDVSGNDIDLTPFALKTDLANKVKELNKKINDVKESSKYYEGEGIRIGDDKAIHCTVNLSEVNQRLDAIELAGNSPYRAGRGIEITPELEIRSTVETDGLESRVLALEGKPDKDTKYTAGQGLQLEGTEFSVNPNELPSTVQIADLNTRVTALEGKPDKDTKYVAGDGLKLEGNTFSVNSLSALDFANESATYRNLTLSLGAVTPPEEDYDTGTASSDLLFFSTPNKTYTNITVLNPANMRAKFLTDRISSTDRNYSIRFYDDMSEPIYSSQNRGAVIVFAETVQ